MNNHWISDDAMCFFDRTMPPTFRRQQEIALGDGWGYGVDSGGMHTGEGSAVDMESNFWTLFGDGREGDGYGIDPTSRRNWGGLLDAADGVGVGK